MKLLITRPNYDPTMSYLFTYSKEIIQLAKDKGFKIFELIRPRLTKDNLNQIILTKKPKLILFNGHGSKTKIYGDKINGKEEILMEEGKNHHLLEKRLTYALSCYAASSLGKKCTETEGCFIGFTAPFAFWMDGTWSSNPIKDKTAKLFLEPSNELIKTLLKGKSAKESVEKFKEISKENFKKALQDKGHPMAMEFAKSLWINMSSIIAEGNENLTINTIN